MTRERREEVVIIALVVSLAIHIALMVLVRPQIMTHATLPARTQVQRGPMKVQKAVPRPTPTKIEELLDLKAIRDAPAAVEGKSAPRPTVEVEMPVPKVALPQAAELPQTEEPKLAPSSFDAQAIGKGQVALTPLPITRIETPKFSAENLAAPKFSVKMPEVSKIAPSKIATLGRVAEPTPVATFQRSAEAASIAFAPTQEVYERVDEQVVEAEKSAVRTLVNAETAMPLNDVIQISLTAQEKGDWRYFKVVLSPKTSLPIVPKDVVLIIDGSGSIGNDRLGSCRRAARQILRTCTNSGDRFNLVVFRNAFSYAFREWRPCDAESFAAGDKWLTKQTAHGRTDVFSTIRSVLALPRDPKRPLIALVVTDGDANMGVSDTAEILSRFTALNDGLISVYMYGVKSSANRELIDVLTHGNRGESLIFDGWRWNAGEGMENLSVRFRDPVLSDLRLIFLTGSEAEAYPRVLRNLYRGETMFFVGRVPLKTAELSFSLKGLNAADAYEGFFKLPLTDAKIDSSLADEWAAERAIDLKLAH